MHCMSARVDSPFPLSKQANNGERDRYVGSSSVTILAITKESALQLVTFRNQVFFHSRLSIIIFMEFMNQLQEKTAMVLISDNVTNKRGSRHCFFRLEGRTEIAHPKAKPGGVLHRRHGASSSFEPMRQTPFCCGFSR
jgi:hypothetical protein